MGHCLREHNTREEIVNEEPNFSEWAVTIGCATG